MEKYSKKVEEFLIEFVLPKLGYTEYNEENIGEIVDYIFTEIEGPLADALADEEILTKEEKELFEIASATVTEITTRSDWDK